MTANGERVRSFYERMAQGDFAAMEIFHPEVEFAMPRCCRTAAQSWDATRSRRTSARSSRGGRLQRERGRVHRRWRSRRRPGAVLAAARRPAAGTSRSPSRLSGPRQGRPSRAGGRVHRHGDAPGGPAARGVSDTEAYLAELTRRIAAALGEVLVGVYLMGLGGDGRGRAGGQRPRRLGARRRVGGAQGQGGARRPRRPCGAAVPGARAGAGGTRLGVRAEPIVELNLDDGLRMERRVALGAAGEPRHWFVLDAAIGREHGRALTARRRPRPFRRCRDRCSSSPSPSRSTGAEHEPDNRKAVLTAARGLRYVLEGRWTSKEDAARWAGRAPARLGLGDRRGPGRAQGG